MKLEEMSMKALLAAHNSIADTPAGPKSFKTKGDLLARVRKLAIVRDLDPETLRQPASSERLSGASITKPDVAEKASPPGPGKRSRVGALARRILIDPSGTPYETIALFVNHVVPGAKATPQSVAWYASRMRKEGIVVPKRAPLNSVCPWSGDSATTDGWLADCGIAKTDNSDRL